MNMKSIRVWTGLAVTFAFGFIAGQVIEINLSRRGGGLTAQVAEDLPPMVILSERRTLFGSRYEMILAPTGGTVTLPYNPRNLPLLELTMMSRVQVTDNRIHYSDDYGLEISFPIPTFVQNMGSPSKDANKGLVGIVANAPTPQP